MFESFSLLGLFLGAFLSATILPFSSELMFLSFLKFSDKPFLGFVFVSMGNCLACLFNYYLGYFLRIKTMRKIRKSKLSLKIFLLFKKYSFSSLFLSFLPIIGDPITLVAGVYKVRVLYFILIVFSLRVLRYIIIIRFEGI